MPQRSQPTKEVVLNSQVAGGLNWLEQARSAVAQAAPVARLQGIIQKQLELAEQGDKAAVHFVFNTLPKLMGSATPIAITQNNFYGGEMPDEPTESLPGTDEKIAAMQRRVAAGRPAQSAKDAQRNLS